MITQCPAHSAQRNAQHNTTTTSTNTIAIATANVGVQYRDTDNMASTIVIEVSINFSEIQRFLSKNTCVLHLFQKQGIPLQDMISEDDIVTSNNCLI